MKKVRVILVLAGVLAAMLMASGCGDDVASVSKKGQPGFDLTELDSDVLKAIPLLPGATHVLGGQLTQILNEQDYALIAPFDFTGVQSLKKKPEIRLDLIVEPSMGWIMDGKITIIGEDNLGRFSYEARCLEFPDASFQFAHPPCGALTEEGHFEIVLFDSVGKMELQGQLEENLVKGSMVLDGNDANPLGNFELNIQKGGGAEYGPSQMN